MLIIIYVLLAGSLIYYIWSFIQVYLINFDMSFTKLLRRNKMMETIWMKILNNLLINKTKLKLEEDLTIQRSNDSKI